MRAVVDAVRRFMALAAECVPHDIAECEINPLVIAGGRLTALDILVKLGIGRRPAAPSRPLGKLKHLLEPRSAAIIGVSEKLNPGRIILNNLIREGFDRERIYVVKPGSTELAGCRCVPDIASLPETRGSLHPRDLRGADAAGHHRHRRGPQGREHHRHPRRPRGEVGHRRDRRTDARVARQQRAQSAWQGPLINGGNCLGIRSLPGRYDTMFIPEYKLPVPAGPVSPVAFVSQSGAFAVSRMSKLGRLNPKYAITLGNQMDLTVGDYLAYLKDDPTIEIFAVYVEGFKELDGLNFLRAAREITASGRTVRALPRRPDRGGREGVGQPHRVDRGRLHRDPRAGAGGRRRRRRVARRTSRTSSGVFTLLRDKRTDGCRLGAISNAGFECVAIADNLGRFDLPAFDEATSARLERDLPRSRGSTRWSTSTTRST